MSGTVKLSGLHWIFGLCLAVICLPVALTAQEPGEVAWPDYDTCLAQAMDRFEIALARSQNAGVAPDYDLLTRYDMQHCGLLAIVACDLSNDRVACQDNLTASQMALRQQVIDSLPASVNAPDTFSRNLYPQLAALAEDSSAGPDCAGADELFRAWCATNMASNDLAVAVLAHKLARLLGATEPARVLGWVGEAPPPRPTERPAP